MARYADEGVRVVLVCATGGEEGEILNPRMDQPGILEKMSELRQAELETAADMLGVERLYMLGYRDSGMPGSPANARPEAFCNADPDEVVGKLVEIVRTERPEVVLSYDESKGYEHPDHVRVHELGRRAFHEAGDPGAFPAAVPPWSPSKLYYFATFSKQRFEMIHKGAEAKGIESPFADWLKEWDNRDFEDPKITTQVDVGDYIDLRTKALLAHATQIDPDSFWFAIPDEITKEVYPWEDYTLVEGGNEEDLPENDLFVGV
jgi:mycothiol S-conjugate amidase